MIFARFVGACLLGASVLGISGLSAQDFFVKTSDKDVRRVEVGLAFDKERNLFVNDPQPFGEFLVHDQEISTGWIPRREPTDVEKIVDGAFMLLTGLMVIATHDAYQINSELRLSTIRGAVFLFFPFEDHNLYVDCGGDHHLVATSHKPTDDILERMKTPQEVRRLCLNDDQTLPHS